MRRKLLQLPSLLAQHALRGVPKPRPQLLPHHHRLLHSPTAPSPPSPAPSPSAQLLWNRLSGGAAASLLPRSAAAVAESARTAASRWLDVARGAGSLDLFSLQRRWRDRGSGWQFASSSFLHGAPWAYWMNSPDSVVLTLIGANVAVFMLWRVADPLFMRRHFMISLDNFKSGRLHTLLTSAFSHADSGHLFSNMFGLYFFGTNVATTLGPAFLLKLYVAGALSGSAFFLLEKAFLAPRKQGYVGWDSSRAPGLGASAAVNATILLQIFLNPKGLVYVYGLIPLPAAFVGAALIGADLYRVKQGKTHVSGSAHLGGALVAALVWARIGKGWI
ncbi:unnamed protein product [Urochloa decumbens]|uniref:Peptidase S54 rhomboid domain-containing protein n=1 Tax=Urochloa decumbens TaxID=240449 RepID=A0ABC8YNW5_9POAL